MEICCADAESVVAAMKGGADRIELCSALSEGGVTPSAGLIKFAVGTGIKVNVLIRPRRGDFLYSEEEIRVMEQDIRYAVELGAAGVVVGALTADGYVDAAATKRLAEAAAGRCVTFHRAFDVCRSPLQQLEAIIGCGCSTLLTSGCAASAFEGADTIRRLVELAAGRIDIMAGAGVSPANAFEILKATGCQALHGSAGRNVASGMRFRKTDVNMGGNDDEYMRRATSQDTVKQIKDIVRSFE